ncbi:hypothetical protein QUA41_30600 [Microcoleus sp. Pol11C1]|uniref:hypothetical protein n=1 Tax=unclassified Microcoleus TaxID=2642155 RepID=UPI002FD07068
MNNNPIVLGELTELRSRRTRILNTQNLGGTRTIDISASSDGSNPGVTTGNTGSGGILGNIIGRLQQFAGFLFQQALNTLTASITQIATTLVSTYLQLESFDWNSTDEEIKKKIASNNEQLLLNSGDAVGQMAAWGLISFANLAIGATLGALGKATGNNKLRGSTISGIAVPVLSGKIAAALAEEGGDEVRDELRSFLMQAKSIATQNGILATILSARKAGFFGGSVTNETLPVDSFASRQQDFIKRSFPEKWQDWAEDVLDSFKDTLSEAIYVVTRTIDDDIAARKYAQYQEQRAQQVTLLINEDDDED